MSMTFGLAFVVMIAGLVLYALPTPPKWNTVGLWMFIVGLWHVIASTAGAASLVIRG